MILKKKGFISILLISVLLIMAIVVGWSVSRFPINSSHPLVIGLVGILLIVIVIHPQIGTYTMVATFWLSTIFPDEGGITFNRILGFVTLAGILLPILISRLNKEKFRLRKFDFLFISYLFVILLSILINGTYSRTFPYIWELFMGYLIYWILCYTIDSRKKLRIMLWVIVFCNIVIALSVINAFVTNYSSFIIRYSGGIQETNTVAVFNAISIIILLWLSEKRGNARPRMGVVNFALLALFSGAMFLTGSRTGFITLLSSLIIVGLFLHGFLRRRKVIIALGVILIVAIVIINIAPATFERVLNIPFLLKPMTEVSDNSLTRLYLNQAAWDMFIDEPITGIGFGGFGYMLGKYSPRFFGHETIAHNIYFSVLAETGALGFLPFALLIGNFYSGLLKKRKEIKVRQENGVDVVYPLALLVGLCVSGMFLWAIIPRLMFIIFSLGSVMLNLLEKEKKDGLFVPPTKKFITFGKGKSNK